MTTATSTTEIADTIWNQIPVMGKMTVGAREAMSDGNTLWFRIGGRKLLKVSITLTPADVYDLKVHHVNRRTWESKVVYSEDGIYADMLGDAMVRIDNNLL